MELVQDKNNTRIGLIGTILFHVVLLLIFIFFGMKYQDPPPPEEGITINFGTSDNGMGDVQPDEISETPSEKVEEISETTPTEASTVEEVMTQTAEETVDINTSEKETPQEKKEEEKEELKVSNSLSEALNTMESSSKSNEGETGKSGDQGDPDGDKNSDNHTGGGNGNGVSFSLAGRSRVSTPPITNTSQDEGTVIVDIVVDAFGKVIKASSGGRGSTTTSAKLYALAKNAALKTKFNVKTGSVDQKGHMKFIFVLN